MIVPDWQALAQTFPGPAVDGVHALFDREGSFFTTAAELHDRSGASLEDAQRLLEHLAERGLVMRRVILTCGQCAHALEAPEAEQETCPHCGESFAAGPTRETSYGL